MPAVVGIDPGTTTAIVVRDGDRLLAQALIGRGDLGPIEAWVGAVVLEANDLRLGHRAAATFVEAATAPSPHLGLTDPAPIIATAHLVGALVVGSDATIVPAARHGSKVPKGTPAKVARRMLEAMYPAELIGDRDTTGNAKTPRQHLRAAWDVAGAGMAQLRTGRLTL